MGRIQARAVADRVHLDKRIRLVKYGGEVDQQTGNRAQSDERTVWAATRLGSELQIGRERLEIVGATAVVIRWEPLYRSLDDGLIDFYLDPDDASATANIVTNVREIGRRRFVILEAV